LLFQSRQSKAKKAKKSRKTAAIDGESLQAQEAFEGLVEDSDDEEAALAAIARRKALQRRKEVAEAAAKGEATWSFASAGVSGVRANSQMVTSVQSKVARLRAERSASAKVAAAKKAVEDAAAAAEAAAAAAAAGSDSEADSEEDAAESEADADTSADELSGEEGADASGSDSDGDVALDDDAAGEESESDSGSDTSDDESAAAAPPTKVSMAAIPAKLAKKKSDSVTVKRGAAPAKEAVKVSFTDLRLSRPLMRAIAAMHYVTPTPIQARTIPLALAGKDIAGSAVTGSGKTAAFMLPALERLMFRDRSTPATRVVVVAPTRELAAQCHQVTTQLAQFCGISAVLVVGGLSLKTQEAELKSRPDIIICTPGRILDHLRNAAGVNLDDVDILILDEADRLLEMGFKEEVEQVIAYTPRSRQTLLFSATMTQGVLDLAKATLKKPVSVSADPLFDMARNLRQEFIRIRPSREGDREAILLALVTRTYTERVIVFCSRKKIAHKLLLLLALAGVEARELHGNLSQKQRLDALEDFRTRAAEVLVATDLASRGLDIKGVKTVINFRMPDQMTSYVHRVGRTARAGADGIAVTLVSEGQRTMMREIVKRASHNVMSRSVPVDVIEHWKTEIASMGADMKAILQSERAERELRLAEMEASKAGNMLMHSDEIAARPKRTWWVSEEGKTALRAGNKAARFAGTLHHADGAAAATAGYAQAGADGVTVTDIKQMSNKERKEQRNVEVRAAQKAAREAEEKKPHRMTRKKRRRAEAMADIQKAAHAAKGKFDDVDRVVRNDEDSEKAAKMVRQVSRIDASVRAAKHSVRSLGAIKGMSEGQAQYVVKAEARAEAQKAKNASKERKRAAAAAHAEAAEAAPTTAAAGRAVKRARDAEQVIGSMFDADMGSKKPRADDAGRRSALGGVAPRGRDALAKRRGSVLKGPKPEDITSGPGENMLRKGGKQGHHSFKSKARYKRR